MSTTRREAYVTLCCNDAYAPGAVAWVQSVRDSGSEREIAILITKQLSPDWRDTLNKIANHIEMVNVYESGEYANLALLNRPELGITYTKLHCWRLTQYEKAVFMDADTLVLQNVDDLFDREELSASPDPGWPDCFNSGVFVYRPSLETFSNLIQFSISKGSFDGGDQGLLNSYFSDWAIDINKRLPYVYNCCTQKFYSYLPALVHFRTQVRVVHFIGSNKPWHMPQPLDLPKANDSSDFVHLWWSSYAKAGQSQEEGPVLIHEEGSSSHNVEASHQIDISDRDRQYAWERGAIDYTGTDRFSNVMAKLNVNFEDPPPPKVEKPATPTDKEGDSQESRP